MKGIFTCLSYSFNNADLRAKILIFSNLCLCCLNNTEK